MNASDQTVTHAGSHRWLSSLSLVITTARDGFARARATISSSAICVWVKRTSDSPGVGAGAAALDHALRRRLDQFGFDAILNREWYCYLTRAGVSSRIKKAMRKRRRIELKKEAKDESNAR